MNICPWPWAAAALALAAGPWSFAADGGPSSPLKAGFQFRHHFLETNLPGTSWGQTALADLNHDGKLDFVTGQKGGPVLWFQYAAAHDWRRHTVGERSPSDVGGTVADVDGDGWPDVVTGGVWYRHGGTARSVSFQRLVFDRELADVHDVVAADVDGDGRMDFVTMSDKNNLRWYQVPQPPEDPWKRRDIGRGVHAGAAVGDLDGDGDLDVVRSNAWYENADGKGERWIERKNIPFGRDAKPYPLATRCRVWDMDLDGDEDLIMTENEIRGGRIAWLENRDGKGGSWVAHALPAGDRHPRGAYHSLALGDFDGDGDQDVFSCEMEGIAGAGAPRWYIWENRDGRGGEMVEHVILDKGLGGHEAVAGDVDGDGDLDLCGKLWRPRADNGNGGRNHVDYLENLRIAKP